MKVFTIAQKYFTLKQWAAAPFQKEAWSNILSGQDGLLNAPTGCGKTFAIWFGLLQKWANETDDFSKPLEGLRCLWITPLKSLSKEIDKATNEVSEALNLPVNIVLRTGDTKTSERVKQIKKPPTAMVTTPESVHILLSTLGYEDLFKNLDFIVVDEWHELLGTKRGVLTELLINRLKHLQPRLQVWGISATIGNLLEAQSILLGQDSQRSVLVQAHIEKKIEVITLLPPTIEKLPWAGHMGTSMVAPVVDIIIQSNIVLIFTNTRAQAEIWYRTLMTEAPELAGLVALHHGSLSSEIRNWVEQALHNGTLKAVVCTSSLDLGVDFQPVDTVIQIGSPKGVARFIQRAGRSGHQPGGVSKIYFVPTHSLEIIEGAALRDAIACKHLETRLPYIRSWDVLCQYLVTLATGAGFYANQIYSEIKKTHCYNSITVEEWQWCLLYITKGGASLEAYADFEKVTLLSDGLYKVLNKSIAMRHRLSIGAIVSDAMLQVKLINDKMVGTVEEYFVSNLKKGDSFWFSGRCLEFIQIKDLSVQVKPSKNKTGNVPSYMGGRMAWSSELSVQIRNLLAPTLRKQILDREYKALAPLLDLQQQRSALPNSNQLLIEQMELKGMHHVFIYPFEGRSTHEGMSALIAARIGKFVNISLSIAMNDFGFHLQSEDPIPIQQALDNNLFGLENLQQDAMHTLNAVELSKRRFRDIAVIGGLMFSGYPGAPQKTRHLQANAQLYWEVFNQYEPDNLLLQQAYDEVLTYQLEFDRLRQSFKQILDNEIIITHPTAPTPFCFPLLVDSIREKFTNEDLAMRIQKMIAW
jgi:ATP-dependent helicase Lhr and Lhr-like helicase